MLALALLLAADLSVLETTAVVDAPVQKVYAAFATAEGLKSWMAGLASVDLRVGGKVMTRYAKDGKLGDAGTIVHTIAAYDPDHMLAWKPLRPPAKFPFKTAWLKTLSVIYFTPLPDGRTQVTNRMLGYDDTPESQKMRAFFVEGNRQTMEALQRHFAH